MSDVKYILDTILFVYKQVTFVIKQYLEIQPWSFIYRKSLQLNCSIYWSKTSQRDSKRKDLILHCCNSGETSRQHTTEETMNKKGATEREREREREQGGKTKKRNGETWEGRQREGLQRDE